MFNSRQLRASVSLLIAVMIACPPAQALVTLNDSHDHIFVNTSFGVSHDSNVFANSDNQGDFVYSTSVVVEYTRRAGWIGMNASVSMGASRYGKIQNQNFNNPSYALELTKQTGRTTGSFTLSGARESRADAAVNIRSTSWNYAAGLNFAYPVVSRLKLAGGLGYSAHKYVDQSALANLSTYSANADLYYVLSEEQDLVGGYRYRYSETSKNTVTTDHAFTGGLNGRLLRGLNGSIRAGYQIRVPHGGPVAEPTFYGFTMSGSTSYDITRKLKLSGQVSKDFSTAATDSTVDSTSANIDIKYTYNSHWFAGLTGGWGDSRFLGESGRVILAGGTPPLLGPNRHDTFLTWGATAGFSHNEHFKISAGYSWFENFSTIAFGDFIRTNWNLNVSSRW